MLLSSRSRTAKSARRAFSGPRGRSVPLIVERLEARDLLAITTLSNGIPPGTLGQFTLSVDDGGQIRTGLVTAQGNTRLFNNEDFIFDFDNFVDVGSDGQAVDLHNTSITMPATAVGSNTVRSEGTFSGQNGPINWRVDTHIDPNSGILVNAVTFTSSNLQTSAPAGLGNLRYINYLDEDVGAPSDDILRLVGTPGQQGFQAFTLDGPERVGFSQSGIYTPGGMLVNAHYDGFAADTFSNLRDAIEGSGTTYSVAGNINTAHLPPFSDPSLGTVFGPGDVTSAFAWSVDPNASTATVTTFLTLVPQNPAPPTPPVTVTTPTDAYVFALYHDVLGRAPDTSGFAFWTGELNAGRRTRFDVADSFLRSPEHVGQVVDQFYLQILRRSADTPGRQHWIDEIVSQRLTEAQVVLNFVSSPEFASQTRDDAVFVNQLYQRVLQRTDQVGSGTTAPPGGTSQAEIDFQVMALRSGTQTRDGMALAFLSSEEAAIKAMNEYFSTFFHRTPTASELQTRVAQLERFGGDPNFIQAQFLSSAEYFTLVTQSVSA
jgi:Domain of unknown function (DUF4214)